MHNAGARGYTSFGIETKNSNHPDLKEFWQIGRERLMVKPAPSMFPNVWPEEVQISAPESTGCIPRWTN